MEMQKTSYICHFLIFKDILNATNKIGKKTWNRHNLLVTLCSTYNNLNYYIPMIFLAQIQASHAGEITTRREKNPYLHTGNTVPNMV